jgi:hypothetical protein
MWQKELTRTLHKGLNLITFGHQTRLTALKELLGNTLKFVRRIRKSHDPDLVLKSFSSAKVVPVQLHFKAAP